MPRPTLSGLDVSQEGSYTVKLFRTLQEQPPPQPMTKRRLS